MKQCSSQLNESVLTLGSQNPINSLPNKLQQCPFHNLSTQLLCFNLECKNNSLICNSKQCQCQQNHIKCNAINAQRFLTNINEKRISTQFIEKFVDDKVQQIIDFLSDFQEKTKLWIKEQHKYFGLNKNQKEFIKLVQMKTFSHIKSNMIWQILKSQEKQKPLDLFITLNLSVIENNFKQLTRLIENDLEKIKKDIKSLDEKIFFNKNSLIQCFYKSGSKSVILTQQKQGKSLQSFFEPMKVKSANLLYRASQYDFSITKFHEKCDGKTDTLILIQTEFGKKIGGFTSITWNSVKLGQYMDDHSMKSFIFSLTNGDKFKMKSKQNAIINDEEYGPIFGRGYDLIVYEESNIIQCSAQINNTYFNQGYKKNENNSYQSFHGNPEQNIFRTNQWQVWKLQFGQ